MTPDQHRCIGFLTRNARNLALAEALRMRGFEVHVPPRDDRPAHDCQRWIVNTADPVEFETALALRNAQETALVALVSDASPERAAEELAAIATVDVGAASDFGTLARAIGDVLQSLSTERAADGHGYQCSYPATEDGTQRCARDLSAFLTEKDVVQAHRIRIASAACEIADNVRRHAYLNEGGAFAASVEIKGTRVSVTVLDKGRGFDAELLHLESVPAALPVKEGQEAIPRKSGGLQRVAALSEERRVQSNAKGTYVELYFELTPVRFEEETEEFAEIDYLDPERMRDLLRALREDGQQLQSISPALSLTIGRLLGGALRGRT